MTPRIIDGPPDPPTPWIPSPRLALAVQNILGDVHRLMRRVKRQPIEDADDWTPDFSGDCQGRVAAAMITLASCRVPIASMRGYTGGAHIDKVPPKWKSHAILGVCIEAAPAPVVYVLDDNQEGIRTLHWMQTNALYKSMAPRMRIEP